MQEKRRDRNVQKNVHKITVYVTYDEIVDIIFLPQREFVISIMIQEKKSRRAHGKSSRFDIRRSQRARSSSQSIFIPRNGASKLFLIMSQLSLSGRKGVLMWGGFLQCCVGQKMYEKSDKEITIIVLYRISFKSRAQKYFPLLSNISVYRL